jgi:hypothetical protein
MILTIAANVKIMAAMTWIDVLVIAAMILTFAAIVSTTLGRVTPATHDGATVPAFSSDSANLLAKFPTTPA